MRITDTVITTITIRIPVKLNRNWDISPLIKISYPLALINKEIIIFRIGLNNININPL